MGDQLTALVQKMQAEGVPEADIIAFVHQFDGGAAVPSHGEDAPARPIATGGGRGTGLDVRKSDAWARNNAPAIGATLATTATGGLAAPLSLPIMMGIAGAGGAAGAAARGDDAEGIATQGAIQGALQGAPAAVKAVAKPIYRVAIPKVIQDKFSQAPLVVEGLRNRILMGTKRGTQAAERAGTAAAGKIEAATSSVPDMTAQDVQAAFRPKYNKALTGGKIDRANEINAHVKQSMDEMGSGPFNAKRQLARKEFLEPESRAAMGQANPNMAAVNPQLANIERKAIVKNLRVSPEMTQALNESQASIGLTKAAKMQENSSLLSRLKSGSGSGIWNAAQSPTAFAGAGIALNELGRIDPQTLRLLDMIMTQGSHQQ